MRGTANLKALRAYNRSWRKFFRQVPLRVKLKALLLYLPDLLWWARNFRGAPIRLEEGQPFIDERTRHFIDRLLDSTSVVFEYGSGSSTVYFAGRCARIYSVEHDRSWHGRVEEAIRNRGLKNSKIFLVESEGRNGDHSLGGAEEFISRQSRWRGFRFESYARTIEQFPDDFFDVILVDGRVRPACIRLSKPKLKAGGFLILDDSHRARYAQGADLLRTWERTDCFGPSAFKRRFGGASFWTKPESAQGVSIDQSDDPPL